jgi:hypothetical protein
VKVKPKYEEERKTKEAKKKMPKRLQDKTMPNELRIDAAGVSKAAGRVQGAAASNRVGLSRTREGVCHRFGI